MVKINWIVTEKIDNVSREEFDCDWNGVYGYFELCINKEQAGYCPQNAIKPGQEGDEDILYWLNQMAVGVERVCEGETYEMQLLCMNLTKLMFLPAGNLEIRLVHTDENEILWSECVEIREFCEELSASIERILTYIKKNNPDLLEANVVRQLTEHHEL